MTGVTIKYCVCLNEIKASDSYIDVMCWPSEWLISIPPFVRCNVSFF